MEVNMNSLVSFTVRIPRELDEQITQRKLVNRRSKNAEVQVLLEQAIDRAVAEDLKLLRSSAHHPRDGQ